jgi:hypothetical protein
MLAPGCSCTIIGGWAGSVGGAGLVVAWLGFTGLRQREPYSVAACMLSSMFRFVCGQMVSGGPENGKVQWPVSWYYWGSRCRTLHQYTQYPLTPCCFGAWQKVLCVCIGVTPALCLLVLSRRLYSRQAGLHVTCAGHWPSDWQSIACDSAQKLLQSNGTRPKTTTRCNGCNFSTSQNLNFSTASVTLSQVVRTFTHCQTLTHTVSHITVTVL